MLIYFDSSSLEGRGQGHQDLNMRSSSNCASLAAPCLMPPLQIHFNVGAKFGATCNPLQTGFRKLCKLADAADAADAFRGSRESVSVELH